MNELKILSAEIKNFKNITSKVIHIDGRSLVVIGQNAAGKSSLIQALISPLDSQYMPSKPITDGEEKGSIKLMIGGSVDGLPKKYNVDVYFTPANSNGRLVVTNELGEVMSPPKTFLKGLVGEIGFDIFEFLKSKPKEQVETLKKLAGINFNEINRERQKIYEDRTFINKKIVEQEAQLKNHGYSDEDISKYSEKIDVAPIKNKISELGKSIENYSSVESGLSLRKEKASSLLNQIKKNSEEIQALEAKILMLKKANEDADKQALAIYEEIKKAEAWLRKNSKPDIASLNEEMSRAEEHNRHVDKLNEFKRKNVELNELKSQAEKMTQDIKDIDVKKEKIISESKLPVKGLGFNEDSPLFNGLPLEDGQINKAKLIEIGARIGMAMNPNLRVLFINDASLLDKHSLKALIEMCEKEKYQLFLEVVDFEGESDMEIKFVEEFLA